MTDELTDTIEPVPDQEDIRSAVRERIDDGTIPIAAGGLALFVAARSLGRGRARSLPIAAVGTALIGIGARNRRSAHEADDEPWTIADEETEREVSDDAHAARQHAGHGPDDVSPSEGEGLEAPSDLEDDGDPRLEGESEVDLSKSARADEPGEATGPEPEQAEPTQSEATEPEPDPEEESTDEDNGES